MEHLTQFDEVGSYVTAQVVKGSAPKTRQDCC